MQRKPPRIEHNCRPAISWNSSSVTRTETLHPGGHLRSLLRRWQPRCGDGVGAVRPLRTDAAAAAAAAESRRRPSKAPPSPLPRTGSARYLPSFVGHGRRLYLVPPPLLPAPPVRSARAGPDQSALASDLPASAEPYCPPLSAAAATAGGRARWPRRRRAGRAADPARRSQRRRPSPRPGPQAERPARGARPLLSRVAAGPPGRRVAGPVDGGECV